VQIAGAPGQEAGRRAASNGWNGSPVVTPGDRDRRARWLWRPVGFRCSHRTPGDVEQVEGEAFGTRTNDLSARVCSVVVDRSSSVWLTLRRESGR
jgi:hypothetical protein